MKTDADAPFLFLWCSCTFLPLMDACSPRCSRASPKLFLVRPNSNPPSCAKNFPLQNSFASMVRLPLCLLSIDLYHFSINLPHAQWRDCQSSHSRMVCKSSPSARKKIKPKTPFNTIHARPFFLHLLNTAPLSVHIHAASFHFHLPKPTL